MAKTPASHHPAQAPAPRQGMTERFEAVSMEIVNEAIRYATGGEFHPDYDAQIRQIRVITMVLLTALQQAQIPRPPPEGPQA